MRRDPQPTTYPARFCSRSVPAGAATSATRTRTPGNGAMAATLDASKARSRTHAPGVCTRSVPAGETTPAVELRTRASHASDPGHAGGRVTQAIEPRSQSNHVGQGSTSTVRAPHASPEGPTVRGTVAPIHGAICNCSTATPRTVRSRFRRRPPRAVARSAALHESNRTHSTIHDSAWNNPKNVVHLTSKVCGAPPGPRHRPPAGRATPRPPT